MAGPPSLPGDPVGALLTGKSVFEIRDMVRGLVFDNLKAAYAAAFPDGRIPAGEPYEELP